MAKFNKIAYFREIPPETMRSLSAGALRVLIIMYDKSRADGSSVYLGVTKLAERTGMAESSVKAGLKQLREFDLIRQDSPGGRSGDGKHWAANYSLQVPSGSQESATEEESHE